MYRSRFVWGAIAPLAFATLALSPSLALAKTIVEPTPAEAHIGKLAVLQQPWVANTAGALQGEHLLIKGSSSDSFGSVWWGGGYTATYEFWDWKNGTNDAMIGAASLRTSAKLLLADREVAYIRVGVHNWTGNVVNGEVNVMGKTVKSWFLTDQALRETYEKSTNFFDKGKDFGIGPFSVEFKATASGSVRVQPDVELKNLRATLNVIPSARVNVTGSAGLDVWLASVKVEGKLDPLLEAKLPVTSWVQLRANRQPCFNVNAKFQLLTMNGKLELVLDYLVNTYRKTIASWSGTSKEFVLVNVGQPCKLIVGPIGPLPPLTPGVFSP